MCVTSLCTHTQTCSKIEILHAFNKVKQVQEHMPSFQNALSAASDMNTLEKSET